MLINFTKFLGNTLVSTLRFNCGNGLEVDTSNVPRNKKQCSSAKLEGHTDMHGFCLP